jgi:hypothetical protein
MANYTLRIWNLEGDSFTDTDFDALEQLYPSVFATWTEATASNIDVASLVPGVNITGGFAVYDNISGHCINSDRANQVGLAKDQPRQNIS